MGYRHPVPKARRRLRSFRFPDRKLGRRR
jgi:hypothetical protein